LFNDFIFRIILFDKNYILKNLIINYFYKKHKYILT
jgi:hypothetical protein